MNSASRDPRKSNYIPTLDGWRGIAISCVLFCHSLHFYGDSALVAPALRPLDYLLARLGTFGVSLFFAISGYLICTLLLIERENNGAISLRSFYIRRFFRIIPPAFAYLLFLALLSASSLVRLQRGELASAAFFFSNYWTSKGWFTTHFWSLSLEEHFYFIWPGMLAFLGNTRAAACAAMVVLVTALLRPMLVTQMGATELSRTLEQTHLRLDSFMVVCLLAVLLRNANVRRCFTAMFRPPVWFAAVLLLLAAIVLSNQLGRLSIDPRSIQAVLLGVIVASTTLRPGDLPARLLEFGPLKSLGRISYSVYLWQQLILQPVSSPNLALNLLWMVGKVAMVIGLASISYRFIEQPLIRLGRRLSEVASKPMLAASAAD